jgi:hypothetical protein
MATVLHRHPAATLRVGSQAAIPREREGFDLPAMAAKMWRPMLAMGVMAIMAGIGSGVIQATADKPIHVQQIAAWNPGLLFLGVGFLLSTVVFVLATILGELRDGGAKVQQSLGEAALILKRPWTGYVFPAAMMMGLMTLIAAFAIGFLQAARIDTNPASAADIGAWVGPLRFAGVALVLTGVVFALATIIRALRFQTDRISQIAGERQS